LVSDLSIDINQILILHVLKSNHFIKTNHVGICSLMLTANKQNQLSHKISNCIFSVLLIGSFIYLLYYNSILLSRLSHDHHIKSKQTSKKQDTNIIWICPNLPM